MQETMMTRVKSSLGPGADVIRQAYHEAIACGQSYALKCLRCGQLLLEQRAAMAGAQGRTCHSGKSSIHGRNQHSDGDGFSAWLEANCPEISQRTAYRWMEFASLMVEGVNDRLRRQIGEGATIDLAPSEILSQPAEALSGAAREWKQLMLELTAGRTMREASEALVEGNDWRLKNIVNGRALGGFRGEDRKDFPKFILLKLSEIAQHLEHWDGMTPEQQHEILGIFKCAAGGGRAEVARSAGAVVKVLRGWPDEICQLVQATLKKR